MKGRLNGRDLPLVSVVIPAFNMSNYLGDALASVFGQTYANLEIIVVDDGSTDNTREVVKKCGNKNLIYHYQENRGESGARNSGIALARSEYIAFLDADDLWMPEKLERQMNELLKSQSIMMIACGYYLFDDLTGSTVGKIVRKNLPSQKALREAISICQIIPGSSSGALVRKVCFDEVGNFSERLSIGADWEMWMRIAYRYEIRFVEDALVKIRLRNNKLEFRTLANEEKWVKEIIETHVPENRKSRAYAVLYARLGRNMMASSQISLGRSYLLKSIVKWPFILFPFDRHDRYGYPKVWRYYLVLKSIIPISWLRIMLTVWGRAHERNS